MTEPTIIRSSGLAEFSDCARRGAARMFRKEVEAAGFVLRDLPNSIAAGIGTSVHRGASVALSEKAATGLLPPVSAATDCAVDEVKEQISLGIAFEGPNGTTHNRDEAIHQVVSMTKAWHRVIAPTVNAILVEFRLEAEFAPGLILSGQPDHIAQEPGAVNDLKTGARKVPGNHNLQIGSYSLLGRSHGYEIREASIQFVPRVRPGKPQPDPIEQRVPVAVGETAAVTVLRHIESDLRVFREGDSQRQVLPGDPGAFMANPRSMLCAERFCPAYGNSGPHSFCSDWQARENA